MSNPTKFTPSSNIFAKETLINPLLRNATIFVLGLVLGWLVLGWALFPPQVAPANPTDLPAEAVNEYLLMTAESYGATHDLRAAGKRLRYWDDPEQLGPKLIQLAREQETTNPAGAAYLQVLAKDLHLPATAPAKPQTTSSAGFNIMWLLIPLLALAVLAGLILIAQRFQLLRPAEQPSPTIDPVPTQPEPVVEPTPDYPQLIDNPPQETPLFQPDEQDADAPDELDSEPEREQSMLETEETEAVILLPDEPGAEDDEEDFLVEDIPEFLGEEALATPPEPDEESIVPPEAFESPELVSAPQPPYHDSSNPAPQILRFDGHPSYNTIIAIEPDDDYLGEFGLSANQTAPSNPNLTLTLEVWLFDKTDTQTTELALVPPVIAADAELKARYIKDNTALLPLKPGQTFTLETAELLVEGRVRQVSLGAATHDGIPVIEQAEIELVGRKK